MAVSAREPGPRSSACSSSSSASPLVADPLPGPLAARRADRGRAPRGPLIWIALRGDLDRPTGGSRHRLAGRGPRRSSRPASSASGRTAGRHRPRPGLGPGGRLRRRRVLAVAPDRHGRDVLRLGIGALLLLVGGLLVRVGLGGTRTDAEQLVARLLTIAGVGGRRRRRRAAARAATVELGRPAEHRGARGRPVATASDPVGPRDLGPYAAPIARPPAPVRDPAARRAPERAAPPRRHGGRRRRATASAGRDDPPVPRPIAVGAAAASTPGRAASARWPTRDRSAASRGLVGRRPSRPRRAGEPLDRSAAATLAGRLVLRLFAWSSALAGAAPRLVGARGGHDRATCPACRGLGLGAAVLALALPDPRIAVLAATAGGLAGILVAAPVGAAARAAFVGVRELRALAVAGALAIVATAWLARPLDDLVGRAGGLRPRLPRVRGRGRDPVRGDPVPPLGGPRRRRGARRSPCRC